MSNNRPEEIFELPIEIQPPPFSPWMTLAILHVVREVESGHDQLLVKVANETREWTRPHTAAKYIDGFAFQLQIEGTSWIWIKELGGSIEVSPGDLVFVPPGMIHSWYYTTETHLAIHFDTHARQERAPYYDIHAVRANAKHDPSSRVPIAFIRYEGDASHEPLRIPIVTHLKSPQVWRKRLYDLLRLFETQREYSPEAMLVISETVLWGLRELHRGNETNDESDLLLDSSINDLIREMKDPRSRLELKKLSVEELAKRTGSGHTKFKRAFKLATGDTPYKYLTRQEMEYAAYLLTQTDNSVKQVARSLGYDDPYHFSRRFHQTMGASPSEYRRQRTQATDRRS